MDEHIAEGDDARQLGELTGDLGIDARKLVEGFADHLELSFDRGSQEVVCLVVGAAFAGREARDALGGLSRVPQEFVWRQRA